MADQWALPVIDPTNCTGCGICVEVCPTHAVDMVEAYPAITRPQDCVYCGECEEKCPEGAIGLGYEIVLPPGRKKP